MSVYYSIGYFGHSFADKFNILSKSSLKSLSSDPNNDYICLNKEHRDYTSQDYSEDGITPMAGGVSGQTSESSRTHFQLLRLAQYRADSAIRELAISALASTHFEDYQCLELAQSCDFETGVRLARIPNISSKLFLAPIKTDLIKLKTDLDFDFETILLKIMRSAKSSGHQCSECTQYFTQLSIELLETGRHSRQLHESIDFDDINDSTRHRRLGVPEVDWIYLQTISQNILCGKTQCRTLVDNGLFLVLHYLRENFSDVKVHDWIAQTLANLSAHKETHLHFWSTRWLRVLVEWLQSDRLEWSLSAAKALNNLSERTDHLLPESMYLLFPIFHDSSHKDYDIVFVHGLMGGAFKTWRQSDSEKQSETYTRCWPQEWLPNDIQNIRVLAVNYQTFLSNWSLECEDNNSVFTLKQRSSQLLTDLIASKVGHKPIVWITHSMGGLLVKQMLVDINESNDPTLKPILNQTKGIVFYSVPHKGTEMAVWSPRLQKMISPSTQLLELRKDSKILHSLHQKFIEIMANKPIECLSFGETIKSTVIKRPFKWKYLLVPESSSNPGVGQFHLLAVDHFNTCKPKTKSSEAYKTTIDFIRNIIESNKEIDRNGDKIPVLLSTLFS